MYIPPRYPDAWAGETAPFESYTKRDAEEAMKCASEVISIVKRCLSSVCKNTSE
jgi:HEPN domain-containing protein